MTDNEKEELQKIVQVYKKVDQMIRTILLNRATGKAPQDTATTPLIRQCMLTIGSEVDKLDRISK